METQNKYQILVAFIDRYGKKPDVDFPADALSMNRAQEFIELLRALGVRPLGIELWVDTDYGHTVDGPRSWYHEGAWDEDVFSDALEYLQRVTKSGSELFVFQY